MTPALSDEQMRLLLDAPDSTPPKGKRDRAILPSLLYLGLRHGEPSALDVGDYTWIVANGASAFVGKVAGAAASVSRFASTNCG